MFAPLSSRRFCASWPSSPYSEFLAVLKSKTKSQVKLLLICYFVWNSFREISFLIHILLLYSFVAKTHLSEQNTSLEKTNRKLTSTVLKYYYLKVFYREYLLLLLHYARLFNKQPCITTSTFNVITINHIFFKNLFFAEKAVLALMIEAQMISAISFCCGLISWSACFRRSSGLLLCRTQLMTVRSDSRRMLFSRPVVAMAKLKLMAFTEQVCTGKKFRFTVGTLGEISWLPNFGHLRMTSFRSSSSTRMSTKYGAEISHQGSLKMSRKGT
ncbi:hypothetical protein TYRP_011525 [Tyrophagus putrescentiae]|nr:hypothetical protein TYRP_011525 [Tyrophagus putrescentiae]